jgi:hypothetical protein
MALFFGAWLIRFILMPSPLVNLIGYAVLMMGVICPLLALRLKPQLKINISMTGLGFILALYSFEYGLEKIANLENSRMLNEKNHTVDLLEKLKIDAKRPSIPIGTLTLLSGINGNVIGGIKTEKGEIVPLSNSSFEATFLCENSNGPVIFKSDRYGFNNLDQVWNSGSIEVAVLGDSYVEGACVKPNKNITAEIVKIFPTTLNLGIVGHGPLTMLGTINEYLKYKQPKTVVWCYSANDIYPNLAMEKDNKTLMQYLNQEFSQKLIERQTEVDQVVKTFIAKKSEGLTQSSNNDLNDQRLFLKNLSNSKFLKLYRLRQIVFRSMLTKFNSDYDLFDKVIKSAKTAVKFWDGKIIFVYLPGPERFYRNLEDPAKERVLKIIKENGIEIIDMEEVFFKEPDPKLFFENAQSHYNEKGYQFVSATILKKILLKSN